MLPLIPVAAVVVGATSIATIHYSVKKFSSFMSKRSFWKELESCCPDTYNECRRMEELGYSFNHIEKYAMTSIEYELQENLRDFCIS